MRLSNLFAIVVTAAALGLGAVPARAAEESALKPVSFSFEGLFGTYDKAAAQRGFQVYKEVCSVCHSMKLVAFRNLGDPGAPFYEKKFPNPNDSPVIKAIVVKRNRHFTTSCH